MGNCCDIDVGDNGPLCYTQNIRKARKQHVCCECKEPINPGDRYEVFSGIWPDGPGSFKTCLICTKIRKDYFSCGYTFGALALDVGECLGVEL